MIVSACGLTASDQGLERLRRGLPEVLVDVAGEEAFEALALALHVMKTIIDTSGIDDNGILSALNSAFDLSRDILLSSGINDSGELQDATLAFHAFRDALISGDIHDSSDEANKADESNKQPSRPPKRPLTDGSGVKEMDDFIEPSLRTSKRLRADKPGKHEPYAFLYNIKQPIMDTGYRQIMTEFGHNVGGFIDTGKMYPNGTEHGHAKRIPSMLSACVRSTSHVFMFDKVSDLQAFFIMLSYYDLAELHNPTGTGTIGPKTLQRIKEQIKGMSLDVDLEFEVIAKWALVGKGWNALCEEFGDGCLLYLANHMPVDL